MMYTPFSCASATICSARCDQRIQCSPTSTQKCLATCMRPTSRPTRRLIACRPRKRLAGPRTARGNLLQRRLGRVQQGLPLAHPLGPQTRIQAHQQALAGKIIIGDTKFRLSSPFDSRASPDGSYGAYVGTGDPSPTAGFKSAGAVGDLKWLAARPTIFVGRARRTLTSQEYVELGCVVLDYVVGSSDESISHDSKAGYECKQRS